MMEMTTKEIMDYVKNLHSKTDVRTFSQFAWVSKKDVQLLVFNLIIGFVKEMDEENLQKIRDFLSSKGIRE